MDEAVQLTEAAPEVAAAVAALVPEAVAEPEERRRAPIREYAESLLVTILLALFGTTFVMQAFKIPSPSMVPTLMIGDHLLVNKFIFGGHGAWYEKVLPYREIRRGDIIVFKFPFDAHEHYVKRVIGVPGDRVKIVDGTVYVNDVVLNEPYVYHDPAAHYHPFNDSFPPTSRHFLRDQVRPEWAEQLLDHVKDGALVVPPGEYFAMGDNRDQSWDSRYWGFVDRDAVMGAPVVIYWSLDSGDDSLEDQTLGARLTGLADAITHFRSRTRWSRMFHEVR
jgi:signal peptidase I